MGLRSRFAKHSMATPNSKPVNANTIITKLLRTYVVLVEEKYDLGIFFLLIIKSKYSFGFQRERCTHSAIYEIASLTRALVVVFPAVRSPTSKEEGLCVEPNSPNL